MSGGTPNFRGVTPNFRGVTPKIRGDTPKIRGIPLKLGVPNNDSIVKGRVQKKIKTCCFFGLFSSFGTKKKLNFFHFENW